MPSSLRKIHIKYFEMNNFASQNMINYFSKLHMGSAVYEMIIIENLDAYFLKLEQFLCAVSLIENLRSYFASKLQKPVTAAFSSTVMENRYCNTETDCTASRSHIELLDVASCKDLRKQIKYFEAYRRIVDRVLVIEKCENLRRIGLNNSHSENLKNNHDCRTTLLGTKCYKISHKGFSSRNESSFGKHYFTLEHLRFFSSKLPQHLEIFRTLYYRPKDERGVGDNRIASYYIDNENNALVFVSA